jgi:hypothetical protein
VGILGGIGEVWYWAVFFRNWAYLLYRMNKKVAKMEEFSGKIDF